MKLHRIEQQQTLPIPLNEAWDFFSRPENLDLLTPPEMRFRILSGGGERMFAGQVIQYRIRVAPATWTSWTTEITQVEEGRAFIDEQRFGPYKFWHHLHRFEEVEGGVQTTDRVHYALGMGPLGAIAHTLYVRRQLERIFSYRRDKLDALFGECTELRRIA